MVTALLVATAFFVVFFAFGAIRLIVWSLELCRRRLQTDAGEVAAPLSPAVLKLIDEISRVEEVGEEDEQQQCPVCQEDMIRGHLTRLFDCGHKYHDGCILGWLPKIMSCPVCRRDFH